MTKQSDDGDDLNVFSDLVEKRVAEKEAARQSVAPPPAASEPAPTSPPPRASEPLRKAVPAPKFRADRAKALSIPPGHKGTIPGFPALVRPGTAGGPPASSASTSQAPVARTAAVPQRSVPPPAPSSTNPSMAAATQRSGHPPYAAAPGSTPHEEPGTLSSSQVTRPSIPPSAVKASAAPASAPVAAAPAGGPPSNPDGLPLLSELPDVVGAAEAEPAAPGFDAVDEQPSIIVSDATPVGDGSGPTSDALVPSSLTSAPMEAASRRTAVIAAVVGITVVVGVFVVAFLLRPSQGSLIVTASGPDSADVDQATVLVDGEQRCEMVPCRVASLDDGTHVIRVSAPGYEASEPRAVSVRAGAEAVCDIVMKPEKRRGRVVAATNQDSSEGVDLDSLPALKDDDRAKRRAAKAKAKKKDPAKGEEEGATDEPEATDESEEDIPTGEEVFLGVSRGEESEDESSEPVAKVGTVNLISLPSSQVAVDGTPKGNTPMTVKLPPGPHSVTFTHPEHGSKSVSVNVKAGKTTAAAVRFP
jgi:hypothetical protein